MIGKQYPEKAISNETKKKGERKRGHKQLLLAAYYYCHRCWTARPHAYRRAIEQKASDSMKAKIRKKTQQEKENVTPEKGNDMT